MVRDSSYVAPLEPAPSIVSSPKFILQFPDTGVKYQIFNKDDTFVLKHVTLEKKQDLFRNGELGYVNKMFPIDLIFANNAHSHNHYKPESYVMFNSKTHPIYIEYLISHTKIAGRGIAKRLTQIIEHLAWEKRLPAVFLSSVPAAIPFYEKMNYRLSLGEGHTYWKINPNFSSKDKEIIDHLLALKPAQLPDKLAINNTATNLQERYDDLVNFFSWIYNNREEFRKLFIVPADATELTPEQRLWPDRMLEFYETYLDNLNKLPENLPHQRKLSASVENKNQQPRLRNKAS
ncbi:unnamed protein product [Didymodactylos carnosus]|uniref:N-acetyltransferase domain-containing protein n=1 Tax=Didymodactylos carnosus TaxID=1234261 RepID=A0A8S2HSU7_9BILA|nr:unnamed protein product [Didymodactylos carnosus]CAF3680766.1 unnamed protein product [Didymodactylos carnosus]